MRLTRRRGAHDVRSRNDHQPTLYDDVDPGPDARSRFGGLDLASAFAGTMAAVGALGVLGALATSWFNASGAQLTRDDVLSSTGLGIGLAIVVLASVFGGWVTGRSSRYEGAGNGLLTGLLLLLVSAGVVALAASQSQAGTDYAIPSWITDDATSPQALTAMGITAGIAVVCAVLGGLLGGLWHRRVDRAVVRDAEARDFTPYPDEKRRSRRAEADADDYEGSQR